MKRHPTQRGRRWRIVVAVFAVCAGVTVGGLARFACAQQVSGGAKIEGFDAELVDALATRGDLDLKAMSLSEALLVINQYWGVNIVLGKAEWDGFIAAAAFENTTLLEILDTLLYSNGYGYRPVGKSLVVVPLEELGDVHPLFEQRVVPLRRQKAEEVIEAVKLMSSPSGKSAAITGANSVLLLDYPDRVAMIERFLLDLDRGDSTDGTVIPMADGAVGVDMYRLQYVDATATAEAVQKVLSELGKTQALVADNAIIVVDVPAGLALVRELIPQMDVPRPQVRITALIYDISLEDIEELGINWGHTVKLRIQPDATAGTTLGAAGLTQIPPGAGLTAGAVTFGNVSRHFDLNTVLQMLHTANDARLLADPNITVVNNTEASIDIVTEVPFQQLSQTQQGGNIGTTAFREVGVQLTVTPHIADDHTIEMHVIPSFSRLTGFTPGEIAQPIIDRRTADTTIRIHDGELLVIGGLRQRTDVGEFTGLPYLKDIKWIGTLFRGHTTTVRESELVVFIMPEIVYPGYCGSPREGAAYHLGRTLLDGIPVGDGRHPEGCPLPVEAGHGGFGVEGEYELRQGPAIEALPKVDDIPQERQPDVQSGAGIRSKVQSRGMTGGPPKVAVVEKPGPNRARVTVPESILFDGPAADGERKTSSSWWDASDRSGAPTKPAEVDSAREADGSKSWLRRIFTR